MATAAELDALIAEARAAKHALATGQLEAMTRIGDRLVSFAKTDMSKLDRYIASLEQERAELLSGTRRRRTFRVYQSGNGYY